MIALTLGLVCLAGVSAIDQVFRSNFRSICSSPDSEGPPFKRLAELTERYIDGRQESDCEHSVGFHFDGLSCDTPINRQMSAFLSDGKRYIFVYTLLTDFKLIEKKQKEWIYRSEKSRDNDSLFVIWIKQLFSHSGVESQLEVKYGDRKVLINLVQSRRVDQQVLLDAYRSQQVIISKDKDSNDSSISIANSYIISCGQFQKWLNDYKKCRLREESRRVECLCGEVAREPIVLYFLVVHICLFALIVVKPIMETLLEVERNERTVHSVYHQCSERTYKHKNVIIVRLANDTPGAKLKHVTIDFEFFFRAQSPSRPLESVAPEFRLKASVLENKPVVDIKLNMYRLTKLPELAQIWCKHSGGTEVKFALFGVMAQYDQKDDELVVYKVNKHIVRHQRRFNLKRHEEGRDEMDRQSELMQMKDVGIFQINLKFLEMAFIVFVVNSFAALMAALFFVKLKNIVDNSLLFILILILICTLLAIIFNMAFVSIYKYLLLMEVKQRARMSGLERLCSIAVMVFVVTALAFALAMHIGVFLLIGFETIEFVLQWFAASLCSSALTAFVWCMVSHFWVSSPRPEVWTSEQTLNSLSVSSQMA